MVDNTKAELLTPAEAAAVLRCSRAKVYRLVADGTLPRIVVGTTGVRIPRQALGDWIARNTVPGRHMDPAA